MATLKTMTALESSTLLSTWMSEINIHKENIEALDTNKVEKVDGKQLSTEDFTTALKNKLEGIASGGEVNQNAFSNVKVGSVTVQADTKTDTLELVGTDITITPDATNDKVTIALPKATSSSLGGVKIGSNISVDSNGTISVAAVSSKMITDALGSEIVKSVVLGSDNLTLTVTPTSGSATSYTIKDTTYTNGTGLALSGTTFSLSSATASTIGGVKVASNANLTLTSGALSLSSKNVTDALGKTPIYSADLATVATTGSYNDLTDKVVVASGTGITVSKTEATETTAETYTVSNAGVRSVTSKSNGVLTVNTGGSSADVTAYSLPKTTTSALGGVIVGSNISVDSNGKISVSDAASATKGVMKLYSASGSATDGTMTQSAITALVNDSIAAADAMIYKGTIGASGCTVTTLPSTTAKTGWTYKVGVAGTYAGQACEVGDMIIALTDGSTTTSATWTVVQNNLVNAVTGSGSANKLAVFTGTQEVGAYTGTVGTSGKPVYVNAGVLTSMNVVDSATSATVASKLGTANVGASSQGIYLASGVATAMSATVGTGTTSSLTPVWMNAGVVTAANATIGGTAKPVYMNAGAVTALTATVGTGTSSSLKPIWMNAGTLTAASASIGNSSTAVYLDAGEFKTISAIASATHATSADSATKDASGNTIASTYEKHVETATAVTSNSLTVTTASPRIQTVTVSGASFTLSFTAAAATAYSERYIHLKNTVATTVTYSGGTWAFNGTAPSWGSTANKNLFIKATFVAGRVILDVLDNDSITLSANNLGSMSLNNMTLYKS